MRLLSIVALGLAFTLSHERAEAKVGDKAWVQCVWSKAATSADAWLALPVPTWQSSYLDANVLLGHRLIATCDATAAEPLRPNRMPNWKAVASAVRRGKPKAPFPQLATPAIEISLCRSSSQGEGAVSTFLYEIVRQEPSKTIVSFRQYYGDIEGQSVKLPQDLRILPKEGTAVNRICNVIDDQGRLSNA